MESTCVPGRIQVSSTTHALLLASASEDCGLVTWQATGGVDVKGKVGGHDGEGGCAHAEIVDAGARLQPWELKQMPRPSKPGIPLSLRWLLLKAFAVQTLHPWAMVQTV